MPAIPEDERAAQVLAVIQRIEDGESENLACKAIGINRGTFRSAALRVEAADAYARACSALAHQQAEAISLTLEDMRLGTIDAQQARVELDARKWLASKFLPKQYGDKVSAELTGPGGKDLHASDNDLSAKLAAILEAAAKRRDGEG